MLFADFFQGKPLMLQKLGRKKAVTQSAITFCFDNRTRTTRLYMNAFVSYSHQDVAMLELLHKHLAQLQRDKIITTWTDRDIDAGSALDPTIAAALIMDEHVKFDL